MIIGDGLGHLCDNVFIKSPAPHTKEPGFLIFTSKNPPGLLENYFINVTRWI